MAAFFWSFCTNLKNVIDKIHSIDKSIFGIFFFSITEL